ncbi:hypothetical protein ES332_D02G094100v1 [Gossypium tomentosum]|uniref:Uncharacterized protein n=1 Tax=Gossypium tomentosum TaxID=34277 RepID=A0A5D2LV22_GOSTO|nr:hypothetical protein ES332_D02G094100v1 [Gossypium tomentosum]
MQTASGFNLFSDDNGEGRNPIARYMVVQKHGRTRTEVVDVAPCTWGDVCVATAQEALETLGVSENYSNRAIVYWAWGFGYFRLN